MHDDAHSKPPHDETELPDALRADLRALYGTSVDAPEDVDARILARAHRASAGSRGVARRARSGWSRAAMAAAIAAALALLLLHPSSFLRDSVPGMVGDLDGNRRIDVVDAMLLARQLREGAVRPEHGDVNGDGRVDDADVERLLRASVALRPEGGGGA